MKKFILLSILSTMFCMNTQAQEAYEADCCMPSIESECCESAPNFYVRGLAGLNFLQVKNNGFVSNLKTGYILSASAGYRIGYNLRAEFEYAYRRNAIKSDYVYDYYYKSVKIRGHINASSYMANLLWDIPMCCGNYDIITPYIGGGIGYDEQKLNVSAHRRHKRLDSKHHTKRTFAWQLMTGLSYPVYENTDLSLEYKFHKGSSLDIYDHSVGVGVTYNFG